MAKEVKRDVPAVQQAMKVLTQYINATDKEVTRLTNGEDHLTERNRQLDAARLAAEQRAFDSAEEVRRLTVRTTDLTRANEDLTRRLEGRNEAILQKLDEAEERATLYERRSDDFAAKARVGGELQTAAKKLIAAFDALPTKKEEATLLRSTTQEVWLYDTSEWKVLTDAKFLLLRALTEWPEEEDGA